MKGQAFIQASNLKTNRLKNPSSLTPGKVILSWVPVGAKKQTAFQIVGSCDGQTAFDSGKVISGQFDYQPDYSVPGCTRIDWTLVLWDEADRKGSIIGSYFATVPMQGEWTAKWIDPEESDFGDTVEKGQRKPGAYLQKCFSWKGTMAARLYATAHGIYDIWLNKHHLDGWCLAPGTSQYDKRLMVQAYDISAFLKTGENVIEVSLGDGWYRGCIGNSLDNNTFGEDIAFLCQIMAGGEAVLISDNSWQACNDGALGLNDLMKGEEYDAGKEGMETWHSVTVRDYGYENLIGSDCQPICQQERFRAKLLITPAGETVLDFGQNFAGYAEFCVDAKGGEKIVLTHGETLDQDGNFTIDNFQNPRKPECFQKVTYVCKSGQNHYHPTKCYFGFRYVKIETELEITGKEFTGVAIYSNMEETCRFSCGVEAVNQLFRNTVWSMKSNFVGVPTDCPTREKSGFTGDAQIFCRTAVYLMDSYPVFSQWLKELSASAFPDGGLRQVAPDHRKPGYFENSCGWCDAIEIIPWRLWKECGSLTDAEDNYEAMKRWLLFNIERAKETRPENQDQVEDTFLPYYLDMGFHWGEWLEPGCDTMQTTMYHMQHGEPEVATAYLAYGCRLMAEMAEALEKKEDAEYFSHVSQMATEAYRQAFLKDGKIDSPRQCRYVRPLALGLLTEAERYREARTLADKILENGGHLNTGFLSTGELCRVLTDNGQVETAYDLLLQPGCPGWLYPISKGAVTVWERWDGIAEDGTVSDSLNHYAYGAVVGWLIDRVCGITIDKGTIRLQPYPDRRLGYARAEYWSYLGKIVCGWRYTEDGIVVEAEIPCGCMAEIILPDGTKEKKETGLWYFMKDHMTKTFTLPTTI